MFQCIRYDCIGKYQLFYCSSHEGIEELGDFTFMLNCFNVASNAVWFPEK